MTIVSILEKLIPARLREPVQIFIASRIVDPITMYVDVREDLFGRSELLVQMLEQRMIRGEQTSKAALNAAPVAQRAQIAWLEERIGRLEEKLAQQEADAIGDESSTAARAWMGRQT